MGEYDPHCPALYRLQRLGLCCRGNAEFAGVDNAGVDNAAPCGRDRVCRSGQISTMWQGWTLREWTMQ